MAVDRDEGLPLPEGICSEAEAALGQSPVFMARLRGYMEGRGLENGTLRVRLRLLPQETLELVAKHQEDGGAEDQRQP